MKLEISCISKLCLKCQVGRVSQDIECLTTQLEPISLEKLEVCMGDNLPTILQNLQILAETTLNTVKN